MALPVVKYFTVIIMKERIYSIPLTDALHEGCGCILCTLEKKLEQDAVNYFLGPSLMEPDGREITNERGFCRRHLEIMLDAGNRLGLALMLETHVRELIGKLTLEKRSGAFKKGNDISGCAQRLKGIYDDCAVCRKIDEQMKDAAGNLVYLWNEEEDFRTRFERSSGLCLEHTALALSVCEKEISEKRAQEFAVSLMNMQKAEFESLYDSLHNFTMSFDYRFKGELDEKSRTSVSDAAAKLSKI